MIASGAAVPVPGSVIIGQNVSLTIPVATSVSRGAALADGDYTLVIGPVEAEKKGEADSQAIAGDTP